MHCNMEEEEDALDTKGYVQYNYDDGTSLQWYEFTLVRVDFGTSLQWYELTIKPPESTLAVDDLTPSKSTSCLRSYLCATTPLNRQL